MQPITFQVPPEFEQHDKGLPVKTTLPDTKMSSTTLGCFMRYIRPGKISGSYCRDNCGSATQHTNPQCDQYLLVPVISGRLGCQRTPCTAV